jgi:Ca2+-binding RTX toxin-like protein
MRPAFLLVTALAVVGLAGSGKGWTAQREVTNGLVAYSVEFEVPSATEEWGVGGFETMFGLCAKDLRTGRTWRLTGRPKQADGAPAWSPDGRRLAFDRIDRGDSSIVVMNAVGDLQVVKGGDGRDAAPAWSPDGTMFAFVNRGVSVMNIDGSERRKIAEASRGGAEESPQWSPDGSRIAFVGGEGSVSEIFLVNPDGTGRMKLTEGTRPSWSPDGTRIAFDLSGTQVYTIGLDGTGRRKLTKRPDGAGGAAWSPDGRLIGFESYNASINNDSADLYVMKADGTAVRPLSLMPLVDWDLAWQPRPAGAPSLSLLNKRPPCAIVGTTRADRLVGTTKDDLAYAKRGGDVVRTLAGDDMAAGGRGADLLVGGPGSDRLGGGVGDDRLRGGRARDTVFGGEGRDDISGGTGADVVASGSGDDVVRAVDGVRDRITCGRGFDRVEADSHDRVAADCERVRRR